MPVALSQVYANALWSRHCARLRLGSTKTILHEGRRERAATKEASYNKHRKQHATTHLPTAVTIVAMDIPA